MFYLETHVHTKEGSACASATAYHQVKQYKNAGYDGILVTDHFINGNSAVDRTLPWDEMMFEQFKGYREAKIAGEQLGLKVFLGIEYAYYGTEFLVIGLDHKWFTEHPEVTKMAPDEFLDVFRDAGAAVIQAHPFREASYIKEIRLFPDKVDAIEGWNSSNSKRWNDSAMELVAQKNKPYTAGSDCHHNLGYRSGIALYEDISDTKQLIDVIKSGTGWEIFKEIREIKPSGNQA